MNNNDYFESIFQNSPDAQIIVSSDAGLVLDVNSATLEIFNYKKEKIIGKDFSLLFPLGEETTKEEYIASFNVKKGIVTQEYTKPSGEIIILELIISDIPWNQGKVMLVTLRDVTERVMAERKLKKAYMELEIMSRTDPLTNLLNRRAMWERLNYEAIRFERNNNPFTLILGDIDNFKQINDNYGHNVGDEVLIAIADTILDNSRKQDSICRWGGEEFLLLLPETNLQGGKKLAEKLRQSVKNINIKAKGSSINISMTFGVAMFDRVGDIEDCIRQADNALYRGKGCGKDSVCS